MVEARKDLWSKELHELSKYDWLTAVGLSPDHRTSPLDLRIAITLMSHADPKTKLAWPSQQTLMAYAGVADERQVRTAISSLCASGALVRIYIGKLDSSRREKINRTSRGKAYELQMFWAFEVFEASANGAGQREPPQLRSGKQHRTTAVRSKQDAEKEPDRTTAVRAGHDAEKVPDRTTAVPPNRTTAVRYEQDYSHPPNPKLNLKETERAGKTVEGLAPTRESNGYAKASRGG